LFLIVVVWEDGQLIGIATLGSQLADLAGGVQAHQRAGWHSGDIPSVSGGRADVTRKSHGLVVSPHLADTKAQEFTGHLPVTLPALPGLRA